VSSKSRRRRLYQTSVESSSSHETDSGTSGIDAQESIVGSNPPTARTARRANKAIRRWCGLSAAYGVIPIPGVELAAVSTSQLLMLREIAREHDIEFSWRRGNLIIATLLGGVASCASMILLARIVSPLASVASLAGLNSTMTYLLGQKFSAHIAEGGTLDDFDVTSVAREFVDNPFSRQRSPKGSS